jgi:ABC-2 type transport system permease protein
MSVYPLHTPVTSPLDKARWAVADGLAVAKRNLAHIRQIPYKLIDATLQPLLMVVLFGYAWGTAIAIPGGGSYREYVVSGIFSMVLFNTVTSTSVGMATDMSTGLIDRFRSLPMSRSAVLIGRMLSDLLESGLALLVVAGSGLAIGWRAHEGIGNAALAFLLLLLFGFSMSCLGNILGLSVQGPESAQTVGFIIFFPLIFLSNSFIPTDAMPAIPRKIAEWNPLSVMSAATRDLFGNPGAPAADAAWPLQHAEFVAFAWCIAIIAIFLPLGVRRYLSATSR